MYLGLVRVVNLFNEGHVIIAMTPEEFEEQMKLAKQLNDDTE